MNADRFHPTNIDELIEFLETHTKRLKKIRTLANKLPKKHTVTIKSLDSGDTWEDILVGESPDDDLFHLYSGGEMYFDDDIFIPDITRVAMKLLSSFCDADFEIISQGKPIIPNT